MSEVEDRPGPDGGTGPAERLRLAVGHALTGQRLGTAEHRPDSVAGPVTVDAVVEWLAAGGWDAERLRQHRQHCQAEHAAWPHPVPGDLVDSWGQLHSLLQQVRAALGLAGLQGTVRRGPRVIGPDERRLLADKPPHHG